MATVLSYSFVSATFSRLFGAGGHEVVLSMVTGLAVGLLSLASANSAALRRLFVPLAGVAVSLLAVLGAFILGHASDHPVVTLAELTVLIPGLNPHP